MIKVAAMLASLVLVGLISQCAALGVHDPCTNPSGRAGRCIFARECNELVEIVRKPVKTPQDILFVQKSKCGSTANNVPLACCAEGTAPSSSGGLLKPPKCGQDLADRIFAGQPTELDEFPWAALIHYRKPNGRFGFHCGGSLINSRYVITAAHCIEAIPRGWTVIGVRLGEYDLSNETPDCKDEICADAPVDLDVEKIIVHEDYSANEKSQWNDIALIRFSRDVSFSAYVKPICLPVDNEVRSRNNVGTKGTAVGWGRTETANASPIKLKVQLDITDPIGCSTVYKRSGVTLRDTQMCAGGLKGTDTCSGDSGGPLMKRIGANYFVFGIVSFGPTKCGTKDVPGVYTNVAKYVDWVASKLEA